MAARGIGCWRRALCRRRGRRRGVTRGCRRTRAGKHAGRPRSDGRRSALYRNDAHSPAAARTASRLTAGGVERGCRCKSDRSEAGLDGARERRDPVCVGVDSLGASPHGKRASEPDIRSVGVRARGAQRCRGQTEPIRHPRSTSGRRRHSARRSVACSRKAIFSLFSRERPRFSTHPGSSCGWPPATKCSRWPGTAMTRNN